MKKPFYILIAAVFFISAIMFYLSGCSILYFMHQSKWGYCIDDFEVYQADFEAVSKFCQDYLIHCGAFGSQKRWFFVYEPLFSGAQKGQLYARPVDPYLSEWQMIETPEEIALCIVRIESAFKHKDASFDLIECFDGKVYFETYNGLYSVVYSPNERPEYVDFVHKGMARKITGDWYHVVPEWE